MPDKERVGFVGLGIMGKAQAANLLKAGFPLTVYNRTRSKAEELGAEGATVADTPADVRPVDHAAQGRRDQLMPKADANRLGPGVV